VGDFFQQSLKSRIIDAKLRFAAPRQPGMLDPLFGRMNDWLSGIFQSAPEAPPVLQPAPWTEPMPAPSAAPVFEAPLVVEPQPVPDEQRAPLFDQAPRAPAASPEVIAPQARAPRRIEGLPRIVIGPSGGAPSQADRPQWWPEAAPVQGAPAPGSPVGEIVREVGPPQAMESGSAQ
jgi:penicillin-binding protein 1A